MFSTFRTAAMGAAALALAQFASPAQAAYVVTLEQVGANVVATGSGTLNLAGLNVSPTGHDQAGLLPREAIIITGPATQTPNDIYTGFTGPTNFGSGLGGDANTGSGSSVDIRGIPPSELSVPAGYVSGNPLSDSATYDNATFSSLGVTPGTYTWTWGTGANADRFTLQIGPVAAAPEPASLTLLAMGLAGLVVLRTRPG
jgi:hypothetical protein